MCFFTAFWVVPRLVPGNEVMFDDDSYPFRTIDHLYQEMRSFSMTSLAWNLGNNGNVTLAPLTAANHR